MARILVGIAGSIAAYRSPDFIRELRARGHDLRIVLTEGGAKFVTPKTLETFAGARVQMNDIWNEERTGTDHIEGARWAHAIVVYGATANLMAKLAQGFCDDFLSLQILASTAPVVLCPAMNVEMWQNGATQANYRVLRDRGVIFSGPQAGDLACGEKGVGHIASHEEIILRLREVLSPATGNYFDGKSVLVTLGSMRTAIDEVRFLQNASSGRMGLEIARSLLGRGATVRIAAGILSYDVERDLGSLAERFSHALSVERYANCADYRELIDKNFPQAHAFFSAAAVLDFEVRTLAGKIPRGEATSLSLPVEPTVDFVAEAVKVKRIDQKIVAFALESGGWDEVMVRAARKLRAKGADALVVNRSGSSGEGPDSPTNEVRVLIDGEIAIFGKSSKAAVAEQLIAIFDRKWAEFTGSARVDYPSSPEIL